MLAGGCRAGRTNAGFNRLPAAIALSGFIHGVSSSGVYLREAAMPNFIQLADEMKLQPTQIRRSRSDESR
jgi:hypothetical protein